MAQSNLARLDSVPLREVWSSESGDFTPWLAQENNLKLLGEAIGIELEPDRQEVLVGSYRADIFCKEIETGKRVVIENQIEYTDHSHLGQILTYAAGLNATILIWVAEKFTEEHRAALDWLNECAKGSANSFGVEIELYRIDNSPPAPRFNVVSKPNNFSNHIKQIIRESSLSATEQFRVKYWTAFISKLDGSKFRCKEEALEKSYLPIQCPIPNFRAGFEIDLREGRIYTYFGSRNVENINILRNLQNDHKDAIECDLGVKTEWTDNKDSRFFWISTRMQASPRDEKDWPRQYEWLKATLEKLIEAISKYLK